MVQVCVNANEAKVFNAHATPLGLCDNLINMLKLLANQQKDGDSPIQSIVTGLHDRNRRGIMERLRRFIQADNHRAVDVGHLRQGTRSLEVQKPEFSEAFPEEAIRKGADELTLRADEVETQRAFIVTDHIESERWEPLLVVADWHAFCQAIYKGVEWEELYCHCREMSKATGAQKPSEGQKAKALWAMKGAWDRCEGYYDTARKEDIPGKKQIPPGFVGRTPQRPDCGTGKGVGMLGESQLGSAFGFTSLVQRFCEICGKGPGPMGCCGFAHIIELLE